MALNLKSVKLTITTEPENKTKRAEWKIINTQIFSRIFEGKNSNSKSWRIKSTNIRKEENRVITERERERERRK